MIKNCAARAWVLALAFALAAQGCDRAGATGQAEPLQGVVEHDEVTLAFEVTGRVSHVYVREGDALSGEVILARLDEGLTRPERDAKAAELEAARAQLALLEAGPRSEDVRAVQADLRSVVEQQKVLERQRARQAQLTRRGAAPAASLDALDAQQSALAGRRAVLEQNLRALKSGARPEELDAARAQVQALQAQLAAMDARLARFTLTYDAPATVLEVLIKPGEVAAAGAPAFLVADLDHPYVDVFVPQARISTLAVGMPMEVRIDALDQPVFGHVERVNSNAEFTPRFLFSERERENLVIRVRVRIDDPRHLLRAGVPAFVTPREKEP